MSEDKTIIAETAAGLTDLAHTKRLRACLVQYSGTNLGKRYMLDMPEMIIGRGGNCKIVINEQSVSRQHAMCSRTGDDIGLEDLGSSNGTFVNDKKIDGKVTLNDGDFIRLGNLLFKYFTHNNIDNIFADKIYRMATIDGGTQTFNKKYLLESLDSEFKYSRTHGQPLTMIYFDLDHFKKVNDTYGHNAGDFILKETATVVKSLIRKEDVFCRFGGEEFVILLPNTEAKTAYETAERIRLKMESHPFKFESHDLKQTASFGVSQLNASMTEPKHLLDDADRKLYKSKQNGRNQVTI